MGKINVNGEGIATAAPDVADVSFSVRTEGKRPSESISKNSEVMTKLLTIAEQYGVEKKDTKTTGFGNDAVYEPQPKPRARQKPKPPKISHYEAYNEITVRLRDISRLGEFLTELASGGAMSLSSRFDIGDKASLQKDARTKAFNDAKSKAEQYAQLSGTQLGKLAELSESARWGAPGGARFAKQAVTASVMLADVPMEGGEQSVTVSVNAQFEIA